MLYEKKKKKERPLLDYEGGGYESLGFFFLLELKQTTVKCNLKPHLLTYKEMIT